MLGQPFIIGHLGRGRSVGMIWTELKLDMLC